MARWASGHQIHRHHFISPVQVTSTLIISTTDGLASYTRLYAATSNGITESQLQFNGRLGFVEPIGGIFRMVIDATGKIGIGTTNPISLLHIENNGNVRITLKDASNPTGKYFQIEQDGDLVSFNDDGIKQIISMNLTSGNVGIGTTSPDHKLDVCGTIRSKEWIVQTTWCDYKLAPDYKRMSWQEKRDYVLKFGHLPEIDPGIEIEKNGLEVGKTMKGFAGNIEDNTMDIIDISRDNQLQKEKIDAQQEEINHLKDELAALKRKYEILEILLLNAGK